MESGGERGVGARPRDEAGRGRRSAVLGEREPRQAIVVGWEAHHLVAEHVMAQLGAVASVDLVRMG